MKKPIIERLLAKSLQTEEGCRVWVGSTVTYGYGTLFLNGRPVPAHRASFEAFVGSIPEGLVVMHSCDRPACIHPSHLSVGTKKDNTQDAVRKGRMAKGGKLRRGSGNGRAKLTPEIVEFCRQQGRAVKRDVLAQMFGVHVSTIERVQTGRAWV